MQMLADFAVPDFAPWKAGFDAAAEERMQAGLTLLQMWRGADDPAAVTCLFEVNDRAKAERWLTVARGLSGAGGARFLRTA